MKVIPNMNSEEGLTALAEEFMEAVFTADPTAKIWPWKSSSRREFRTKQTKHSLSYAMARDYLDRLWVRNNERDRQSGFDLYARVNIQHKGDSETFLSHDGFQHFRDRHRGLIFKQDIQAEDTKNLGHGLYSTPSTDCDNLSTYFRAVYNITIACRWRPTLMVSSMSLNGVTYTVGNKDNEKVMAVHFECDAQDQTRAKHLLQEIYSVRAKDFPLGHKMRFVPHIADCQTAMKRQAVMYLISRQRAFLSSLGSVKIYNTQNQYKQQQILGNQNLMEMIRAIPNPNSPDRPLFLTVATVPRTTQLVVHYFKQDDEVASDIAANLYPFFRSVLTTGEGLQIPARVLRKLETFFTMDAIEIGAGKIWDSKSRRIISTEDLHMQDLLFDDDEFSEFMDEVPLPELLKNQSRMEIELPQTEIHVQNLYHNREEDSIGTLRTQTTNTSNLKEPPQNTLVTTNNTDSSISSPSTNSTTTFTQYLSQFGVFAADRRGFQELTIDELQHMQSRGAYLPPKSQQRLKEASQKNLVREQPTNNEESGSEVADEDMVQALDTFESQLAEDSDDDLPIAQVRHTGTTQTNDESSSQNSPSPNRTHIPRSQPPSPSTRQIPPMVYPPGYLNDPKTPKSPPDLSKGPPPGGCDVGKVP